MPEYERITKTTAAEAVRAASWAPMVETCGHTGCEDHRGESEERMIHCYSFFGCDVSLDSAIADIETAREVGWNDHMLRHDLRVETADGKVRCFDVKRPEVVDADPAA